MADFHLDFIGPGARLSSKMALLAESSALAAAASAVALTEAGIPNAVSALDYNLVTKGGFYRSGSNSPVVGESSGMIQIQGASGRRYQMGFTADRLAVRYGGPSNATPGPWVFYLRTGEAVSTTPTTIYDANDAIETGYYWLPVGSLNTPVSTSQFILNNIRRANGMAKHEITEIRGTNVSGVATRTWRRHRTISGTWQVWSAELNDASVGIAHYKLWSDIKNFAVNGTPLNDASLAKSMTYEMRNAYTSRDEIRAPAKDLAECTFSPVSETDSARLYPQSPMIGSTGSVKRRTMPITINSNLVNTPIAEPIFVPQVTGARGWLSFKYIGAEPLYTVLKGDITMLARITDTNAAATQEFVLKLRCLDPKRYDTLEGGTGERGLSTSMSGNAEPRPIRAGTLFSDPCLPITHLCLTTTEPNLYVGSDNGYLDNANPIEEVLTTDASGAVPPDVRTTKWINVSAYDTSKVSFFMYCPRAESDPDKKPYSQRRRIQIKTATGQIRPLTESSWDDGDNGAFTVYRLPTDAAQFRVYYAGRGSDVHEPSIIFKAMSPEISATVDPTKGLWREVRFNVCREVVFYTDCTYCFTFEPLDVGEGDPEETPLGLRYTRGAINTDFGFRYEGGLTCLYEVSQARSRRANAVFGGLV